MAARVFVHPIEGELELEAAVVLVPDQDIHRLGIDRLEAEIANLTKEIVELENAVQAP
jgi:hypothetical protein